ncbi:MAG: FmdB family zinc ribbon protein [Betaproteobacteria bacterium]
MPIYEYVCGGCQARFEKLVRRFGDEVACPSCASGAVDRQLSVFAVAVGAPAPALAACGAGACSRGEDCGQGACGGGACGMSS